MQSNDEFLDAMREPANPILAALDALASALVDHGHEWTEKERILYEQAVFAAGGGPPAPRINI